MNTLIKILFRAIDSVLESDTVREALLAEEKELNRQVTFESKYIFEKYRK